MNDPTPSVSSVCALTSSEGRISLDPQVTGNSLTCQFPCIVSLTLNSYVIVLVRVLCLLSPCLSGLHPVLSISSGIKWVILWNLSFPSERVYRREINYVASEYFNGDTRFTTRFVLTPKDVTGLSPPRTRTTTFGYTERERTWD